MNYKHQKIKNKAANTHYRSWKKGKNWYYGFSTLAVLAGGAVMFQEKASADVDTALTVSAPDLGSITPDPTDVVVPDGSTAAEQAADDTISNEQDVQNTTEHTAVDPNSDVQSMPDPEPTEEAADPGLESVPVLTEPDDDTVAEQEDSATPAELQPNQVTEKEIPQPAETIDTTDTDTGILPAEVEVPILETDDTLTEAKAAGNPEQETIHQLSEQQTETVKAMQTPAPQSAQASMDATGVWGDITWVYDAATQTLRFTSSGTIPRNRHYYEDRSWMGVSTNNGQDIKRIIFEQAVIAPENASSLFAGISNLQEIFGLENIDVSSVTTMDSMFEGCSSLVTLAGLANWDVSNMEDMEWMFSGCSSLTDLPNLSDWSVSNVYSMSEMFRDCTSLVDLAGISSWDTSNVEDMSAMFYGCSSLTNLSGLSNWNVSSVYDMNYMFYDCTSLVDLTGLSSWNVHNVTDMREMFYNCSSLVTLTGLENWDVSNVEMMGAMFEECLALVNADALNNWQVPEWCDIAVMFRNCTNLQSVGLASWSIMGNDSEIFAWMFEGCSNLRSMTLGPGSYWLINAESVGLPEIDSGGEYTGEWIGVNTGKVYANSEDLAENYDGRTPDTYVWRKKNVASIHYDVNGGDASTIPTDQSEIYLPGTAHELTVSDMIPVRDETDRASYGFIGWNTNPNGYGDSYQPGDVIVFVNGAPVTLYAQWKENKKASTVTVHYVDEAGNEIADSILLPGTIDDTYATWGLSGDQLVNGDIMYLLLATPANAAGEYAPGGTVVTYVYRAVNISATPVDPEEPVEPEEPENPAAPEKPANPESPVAPAKPAEQVTRPASTETSSTLVTNLSTTVSASQAEATVTRVKVLPNTGAKSGTAEALAGAFSLLGAGVGMAVRMKRRKG